MRSIKDIKKTIIAIAAVIAVFSLFTGCTPEKENGIGVSTPDSDSSAINDVSEPAVSSVDSSDNSEESAPVSSSTTESSDIADNSSALPSQLPTTVVDPNETQVPAQTTPIVIPSSSKPTENKPTQSKPSETVPGGPGLTGGEWAQNPSSSTPSSSSTPTQSTPPPSSSGNVYEQGKYTGYTPTDTTGVALDANGCPADGTTWTRANGTRKFVDSTGQLWEWERPGWKKAGPGEVIDHSGYIDPDFENIKPGH